MYAAGMCAGDQRQILDYTVEEMMWWLGIAAEAKRTEASDGGGGPTISGNIIRGGGRSRSFSRS